MGGIRVLQIAVATAALVALAGCEQVFTYNVFSSFQRNPENLSPARQKSYAESALESGDQEAMAEAYAALRDDALASDDPELTSLATDLALGASGINDVAPELAEKALSGELSGADDVESAVGDALDQIQDTQALEDAAALIEKTKENGGTVSEDQYVLATAGLVAKEAKEVEDEGGSIEDLDSSDFEEVQTFVDDAQSDLESRGETSETLQLLEDYIGGTT
ncbi:MAG: hypothetical protein GVY29_13440 [Spirochaetes bacterium]|jgi:hypothetical protein|nr:hypothetical protein [Spirochaetota bacterium]